MNVSWWYLAGTWRQWFIVPLLLHFSFVQMVSILPLVPSLLSPSATIVVQAISPAKYSAILAWCLHRLGSERGFTIDYCGLQRMWRKHNRKEVQMRHMQRLQFVRDLWRQWNSPGTQHATDKETCWGKINIRPLCQISKTLWYFGTTLLLWIFFYLPLSPSDDFSKDVVW